MMCYYKIIVCITLVLFSIQAGVKHVLLGLNFVEKILNFNYNGPMHVIFMYTCIHVHMHMHMYTCCTCTTCKCVPADLMSV